MKRPSKICVIILSIVLFMAAVVYFGMKCIKKSYDLSCHAHLLRNTLIDFIKSNQGRFPASETQLIAQGFLRKEHSGPQAVFYIKDASGYVYNLRYFEEFKLAYGTDLHFLQVIDYKLFRKDTNEPFRLLFHAKQPSTSIDLQLFNVMRENYQLGFQSDSKSQNKWSRLHEAVLQGDKNNARQLLEQGHDVNIKDIGHFTPLHVGATYGWKEIVQLLLDFEADVSIPDTGGFAPLHVAAVNGQDQIVDILLKKVDDINVQTNWGTTALHKALFHKHEKIAEALLNNGASIDISDKDGYLPVHAAVAGGFYEISRTLISRVTNINVKTKGGYTLLHVAASNRHKDLVVFLIERGAQVNVRTEMGHTSLDLVEAHSYNKSEWDDIVKVLRKHGAESRN